MDNTEWNELVERARGLAAGPRRVLGITGAPGAGKSTVANRLVSELGPDVARLVGMDGFHFASAELRRQGTLDRKGAPHTFDVGGYVSLLRRLRQPDGPVVYAPEFDRDLEESVGSAVPVPTEVPLVVTEGNYLLLGDAGWQAVRPLLDECWFVDPGDAVRLARLVRRHQRHGRSKQEAVERSNGSDQLNAELINSTRPLADLVYRSS